MGLFTSIAEKFALGAATTAFPPLGLALKAASLLKSKVTWCVGTPLRAVVTGWALTGAAGVLYVHHLRGDLAADASTIAQIHAAQKTATDNQIHINQLPALTSAAIARQSDAQAPVYYASVASAAAAHDSVVQHGTCPIGNTGVHDPDPTAPVDDGPSAAPVMVSRAKADDDLIVAAAGRAAQMHQDAVDLIAAGVAVADDAPAPGGQ